jgi:hypothetical protein
VIRPQRGRAIDQLSDLRRLASAHAAARPAGLRTWAYPWDGVEDTLRAAGCETLPLVGFGSLINATSAARTVAASARQPVVAFGVRRLFTRRMSEAGAHAYGAMTDSRQCGALNVVPAVTATDFINGILIDTPLADVPALRVRECGYDLVPVCCVPWAAPSAPQQQAWILSCPASEPSVEPHPGYYQVCCDGAAAISDVFSEIFLATTYAPDGRTLIAPYMAAR